MEKNKDFLRIFLIWRVEIDMILQKLEELE